jgi:hypothetical protein
LAETVCFHWGSSLAEIILVQAICNLVKEAPHKNL